MFAATLAVVGVAMFGDAILPIVPGEVVMLGAVTRADGGWLALAALVAIAALGSLLGQYAAFQASRRVRQARVGHAAAPRRARWPRRALLFAGFVPGGRVAAATVYGATGGDASGFWRWAAVGSVLSAGYLAAMGEAGRRIIGDAWWAPLPLAAGLLVIGSLVTIVRTRRSWAARRSDAHEGTRPHCRAAR